MTISELSITNFRSHELLEIELSDKLTLIGGDNGAGKTNVLEAIHYLCLTKNFLQAQDRHAIRFDKDHFQIEGKLIDSGKREAKVVVRYSRTEGKTFSVNGVRNLKAAELVGRFPVVVFCPNDIRLTTEGPSERRRFINNVLCQYKPRYLSDLMGYRRALRQRNSLLQQLRHESPNQAWRHLEAWSQELASIGSRIIEDRQKFCRSFSDVLENAYRFLQHFSEKPGARYQTLTDVREEHAQEEIENIFLAKLRDGITGELKRGMTLSGPHRDELLLKLDEIDVRRYASQGQHRTFVMALKLAQYYLMRDQIDDNPLLLLDDVFQHLDDSRTRGFLSLIQSDEVGQSIVASANTHRVTEWLDARSEPSVIQLGKGALTVEIT